jgi:hypothetical protein
VSEVRIRELVDYDALVQRNAGHLTRLGDYRDEVAAGVAALLHRLGFTVVADFERYTRFHLSL